VAGHEAFGEILGGFELRGFFGWAKNFQAAGAENIHHAGSQRCFGADNGEMNVVLFGEICQRCRIGDIHVLQFVLACRTGIARRNVNLLQARRLRQPPGHGVLAAAGTDDK
jgi:hypothetical protein